MQRRILAAALAALAFAYAACSTNDATPRPAPLAADASLDDASTDTDANANDAALSDAGPPTNDGSSALAPSLQALSLSSGDLQPAFDPNVTDYEATSLTSLYPMDVIAVASDPSATISIHGTAAQGGVPVTFTLRPREDITVVVHSPGGDSRTYTVHYTPASLPKYSVVSLDAASAGTENVLLTPGGSHLLIVDRAGAPLYYRSFAPLIVENFQQQHVPGGGVMYTALVGAGSGTWTLGVDHVMDAQLRDVGDVQLQEARSHGVLPAEGHDFLVLGDAHYVVMSYVERIVDLSAVKPGASAEARVMNALVQEIDQGIVTFEWDSADVPSLYADSVDGNAFTSTAVSDYVHLNSIDVDPADGSFILSLRHTSSIVKVDRKTTQIVWTLGGAEDSFGLTADQRFSHQHYARVQGDGSLMVFDNGNGAHQTRVLSFSLDEEHHAVASFAVLYEKPADQPQTSFMGSATHMDAGRYLFGWGGWTIPVAAPSVTEVVEGAPVWSLTFDSPTVFSYRALPMLAP